MAGRQDMEHRKEAVHVTKRSPKARKWRFQSSKLKQPVIFLHSLHRPLIQGNLYHQPIALPTVFSRRDSTVSGACYQVESRRSLGEAA
jgi:hypothetical protein